MILTDDRWNPFRARHRHWHVTGLDGRRTEISLSQLQAAAAILTEVLNRLGTHSSSRSLTQIGELTRTEIETIQRLGICSHVTPVREELSGEALKGFHTEASHAPRVGSPSDLERLVAPQPLAEQVFTSKGKQATAHQEAPNAVSQAIKKPLCGSVNRVREEPASTPTKTVQSAQTHTPLSGSSTRKSSRVQLNYLEIAEQQRNGVTIAKCWEQYQASHPGQKTYGKAMFYKLIKDSQARAPNLPIPTVDPASGRRPTRRTFVKREDW